MPSNTIVKNQLRRQRRDRRHQRKLWWQRHWRTIVSMTAFGLMGMFVFGMLVYSRWRSSGEQTARELTPLEVLDVAFVAFQEQEDAKAIRAMEKFMVSEIQHAPEANRWISELIVHRGHHLRDPKAAQALRNHAEKAVSDKDLDAAVLSGIMEFAIGDPDKAIRQWQRAASPTDESSSRQDIYLPLALAILDTEEKTDAGMYLRKAERFYRNLLAINANDHLAALGVIESLIAAEKYDLAEIQVEAQMAEELARDPSQRSPSWESQLQYARSRIGLARWQDLQRLNRPVEQQLSFFRSELEARPNDIPLWRSLLRVLQTVELNDNLDTDWIQTLRNGVAAETVMLANGAEAAMRGELSKLARACAKVLSRQPDHDDARYVMSRALMRGSADWLSTSNFLRASPLPDDVISKLTDGKIQQTILQVTIEIAKQNPGNERYKQAVALALAQERRFQDAYGPLQAASFLNPSDRWIHEALAVCEESFGLAEQTDKTRNYIRDHCDESLEIFPMVFPVTLQSDLPEVRDRSEWGIQMVPWMRRQFRRLEASPTVTMKTMLMEPPEQRLGVTRVDLDILDQIYQSRWASG